jgi:hypothetical protein
VDAACEGLRSMLRGTVADNREFWFTLPAYVLVFLMLVFPDVPQLSYIKVFLFGVILVIVGIDVLLTGRSGLHFSVSALTILLSFMSFLFVLEGFYAGTPGAFRSAQIYVVWPILYVIVIAGLRSKRTALGLTGIMVFSTICISIYSVVFMLIQTGILPENRYFDLISFDWRVQAFGLHDYIAMVFPGMSSLPFLVPFSLAALVTFQRALVRSVWLWTAAALSLVCVLISGRRALYLVTLASPLLTLFFLRFQPEVERRLSKKALVRVAALGALILAISLGSLNAVFGVTPSGMVERLSVGFDFSPTSEDTGATERRTQYHALLAGWMDNPLLGAGHGAPAFGSIRSEESPWNYELHYLAVLYQTGLVGFAAYAAGISWIFWMGVRVIRSGGYLSALMVASLVGMSSILVADATNPYLARYDTMWTIFLPLAIINFWLLRDARTQQFASA